MDEEKQKAADERQLLMSQIASLINASAESQAKRMDERVSSVRDEMTAATAMHSTEQEVYVEGIDAWTNKSRDILTGVAKSRDGVKTRLKADFAVRFCAIFLFRVANNLRLQTNTSPLSRIQQHQCMLAR